MANQLDELSPEIREEGLDTNVIVKKIPVEVGVGIAYLLSLRYHGVVVQDDDLAVEFIELVYVRRSQVGYDHAIRFRSGDYAHVEIVQRGEKGHAELFACTEKGIGYDGGRRDAVCIVV